MDLTLLSLSIDVFEFEFSLSLSFLFFFCFLLFYEPSRAQSKFINNYCDNCSIISSIVTILLLKLLAYNCTVCMTAVITTTSPILCSGVLPYVTLSLSLSESLYLYLFLFFAALFHELWMVKSKFM